MHGETANELIDHADPAPGKPIAYALFHKGRAKFLNTLGNSREEAVAALNALDWPMHELGQVRVVAVTLVSLGDVIDG